MCETSRGKLISFFKSFHATAQLHLAGCTTPQLITAAEIRNGFPFRSDSGGYFPARFFRSALNNRNYMVVSEAAVISNVLSGLSIFRTTA